MFVPAFPDDSLRRLTGAGAVVLLHALIIFALLHIITTPSSAPVGTRVREIILRLVAPPRPVTKPVEPKAQPEHKARTREAAPFTPSFDWPQQQQQIPDQRDRAALRGFGSALSKCAPENIVNLNAEERAACNRTGLALRDTGPDFHDHTDRSKAAALWARRRDRKNAPALLPCANPNAPATAFLSIGTLICLSKGAIAGKFDMDAMPGYADKVVVQHLPNNGDPPSSPGGSAGPER